MQVTNIEIQPQYGSRVAVIPIPADPAVLRNATKEQLRILIALMSENPCSLQAAARSGATPAQIEEALRYWEAAGVLRIHMPGENPKSAVQRTETAVPEKTLERAAQLPHYNTDEAARYLERNPDARSLIDCCQQELGKIFNTSEAEIIIGLLDYLSLGAEYILLLCAYCSRKGRKSLRYIEKTAIGLHDAGIVTYEQLELHLKKLDQANDAEEKLRDMFGIGKRALVKREKEAFFRWVSEWEMPLEVIEKAYEITVARTNEPSVPYTNAILEKWHAEGLCTLAAVEEAEAAKKNAAPDLVGGTSFDTDDFLKSALMRSYGNS